MVGGKVLVLGGIRSGKSAYAESLLDGADSVRYVATSAVPEGDDAFASRIEAHRFRRPASWETLETGDDPARLVETVREAPAGSAMLVDDLGGWVTALLGRDDAAELVSRLAGAVHDCAANLVIVSPEVGLSVVPPTEAGVAFADLLGDLNRGVADACDSVALVVAGQSTWLKNGFRRFRPAVKAPAPQVAALTESTTALPIVTTGFTVMAGMDLPIHDDEARTQAQEHLSNLDIEGGGLGELASTVVFAAGTQGVTIPVPWQQPHMFLLHGMHEGDIAAGDSAEASARLADGASRGEGAIGLLTTWNGVSLKVVATEPAEDIVYGRATPPEEIEAMLTKGWSLADEAVDGGSDLIVLGSCGAGGDGAAAAIVSRLTGAEIATLLARIVGPAGTIDDTSWMLRCAAARDALHRVRNLDLLAKTLLSELAGPDIALACGVILGATARRIAVLLDGPLAAAAALLARDLGSQSRLWLLLPDNGNHPTTKSAADVLGLEPLLDLKTGLGEGSAALLALPLLRSALHLSQSLPVKPPILKVPPGFDEV
ncbi:MAG TPA: bifunctional adenosylcobinamide kinase/adenosylcobinamide-phosphate guanylyltransferase [Candidatus Limnocylindrales bacterium]|nr:bifunctional adenosylcobinamide kinase/adenosylcobinamide-phosphate guanylyltransferase [Candidatus Limnocylindrales bacterium]